MLLPSASSSASQASPAADAGGAARASQEPQAADTGEDTPQAAVGGEFTPRRSFGRLNARSLAPERVGTEISQRYDLLDDELGIGGNGNTVCVGRDRLLKGRLVAVKKVVRTDTARDTTEVIKREVQIMKDLDHPSICKLFETYAKGRHMFFVIEHLEGGDVGNRLVEQGPLPEPMAAAIARQVSGALLYAHSKGIAHRDMKPENICFCSTSPDEFRVKVIDWGLGKHFIEGRLCSSVGTSSYTAPEVLMAADQAAGYTSSCDLWSLGVTAYTMLSGKTPFWGQLDKQLRKMQDERYPLSGNIWDGISDEGKSFVSQLLKFAPEERISAAELLGHPWTVGHTMPRDASSLAEVLRNVERFSHASDILFFCTASLARQLDHRSLTKIYRVFSWLDADGDGRLALTEFADGFQEVFGADSEEFRDVENVFDRLDFERTGSLSYTTFCAAGISEDYHTDDDMLLAAFKTFDVLDNGRISAEDMQEASSAPVWKDVANHVMEKMGRQEGGVNFEEWAMLVRESASRHAAALLAHRGAAKAGGEQGPVADS